MRKIILAISKLRFFSLHLMGNFSMKIYNPGGPNPLRAFLLIASLAVLLLPLNSYAQEKSDQTVISSQGTTNQDGRLDFDFHIGTWKTHLKRLNAPLSGSSDWIEYEGTTVVRKVWDGRANLVELTVEGPTGLLEVLSLRLYNPKSQQWSLNSASVHSGVISVPMIGEFKNGRGEFFSQEIFNGRAFFVRFFISQLSPDSWQFEQAFSNDGGKTWEINWIAKDTRVEDEIDQGN